MKYIKITGGTGYCGTGFEEYLKTDMTNKELDEYCREAAASNAESYDYLVYGFHNDAESYAEENEISLEEAESMMEDYYAETYADWEEVSEEEWKENNGTEY